MSTSFFFYDPFHGFDRPFGDPFTVRLNRLRSTGRAVQCRLNDDVTAVLRPKLDLYEDKEGNTVTATFKLPGITKENIDINVHGYAVRDRKFGKFSRTIQLPQGVTNEQIKASLENGVLTVTFPKSNLKWHQRRLR